MGGAFKGGWGDSEVFRTLNPAHLTQAVVQGHIYDPAGAVEAGYLDRIVASGEVEGTAMAVAAHLATLPGEACAWNKRALRKGTLERIRGSLGVHHAA